MPKIVPIDSIYYERRETSASVAVRPQAALAITGVSGEYVPGPFDSERLPTVLASEIQRFLRVANLIEREEPRVAYICRFCAFEIAHDKDKNSSGLGVMQFKNSLLQRLEQDEQVSIRKRKENSDIRELKRVYHAYGDSFMRHDKTFDLEQSHREKLINARNIASVLFEVFESLKACRLARDGNAIHKKSEF